jgi:ATP-dependent DNA ligase
MPLELAELEAALASPEYGISEKVNGHRTFVAYDGHTELTAYNRRRIKATSVPAAAHALRKLGRQFVVDGERLLGDQAGQYVIFDLLELDGSRLRIASATCSSDIPNFLAIAPLATPMEC